MTNSTLYLIGGTGGLGSEIAKGLIQSQGFTSFKALVRDPTKGTALTALGWTVVKVDDFMDVDALASAMADAKVVVSAVGGSDMVGMEMAAMKAAKKAGASVYVPSQFGVDPRRWGTDFPFLAGKQKCVDFAKSIDLPLLLVYCGFFSDFIFDFWTNDNKITMYGDGSSKCSYTLRSDIGFVLAKALADADYSEGGVLMMAGETLSFKEALDCYKKVKGDVLKVEIMDPQEALKLEKELLKKGLEGDVGAFFQSFSMHLAGEPARGNDGCDMSAGAKSYGYKHEPLLTTLEKKNATV